VESGVLYYRKYIMNIKYKLVTLSLVIASMVGVIFGAPTASALTDTQKETCFNKWIGSYYIASDAPFQPDPGTFKNTITKNQLKTFKDGQCNKDNGGMCWSGIAAAGGKNYAGEQIHCTGADGKDYIDGTYNQGGEEVPQGGGGNNGGGATKCEANILKSFCSSGVMGLLGLVLDIMSAGVGIVAVGGIAYGALLYTTAGGSQEQVKKAIGIIQNVIIGLVAYVSLYAFLQFLLPGGIF